MCNMIKETVCAQHTINNSNIYIGVHHRPIKEAFTTEYQYHSWSIDGRGTQQRAVPSSYRLHGATPLTSALITNNLGPEVRWLSPSVYQRQEKIEATLSHVRRVRKSYLEPDEGRHSLPQHVAVNRVRQTHADDARHHSQHGEHLWAAAVWRCVARGLSFNNVSRSVFLLCAMIGHRFGWSTYVMHCQRWILVDVR